MTLDIDEFCGHLSSDKMNAVSSLELNTKEKFSSNNFSYGSVDSSREGSASPPLVNGKASPSDKSATNGLKGDQHDATKDDLSVPSVDPKNNVDDTKVAAEISTAEDNSSTVTSDATEPVEECTPANANESSVADLKDSQLEKEDVLEAMETEEPGGENQVEAESTAAADTQPTSCNDEKVALEKTAEKPSDIKHRDGEENKEVKAEDLEDESKVKLKFKEERDNKEEVKNEEIQTAKVKSEDKKDAISSDPKDPILKEDAPNILPEQDTSTAASQPTPVETTDDPVPVAIQDGEKKADTSGSTDNKMETTENQKDFLSDNKMDTTENKKDAISENTREASPNSKSSSKNFQFVDESVQDEDPVSIINEISFEPVNSNDTDEEEDDEDDPPGLETVEIPPTRKEKEKEVPLKESTQKEKEVIQKEKVTQKEKVVSPAVEQKLKEKKVEEVEVTTIDDDDDDDTDPVRNYDQALREINRIDERARKVLDSEESRKRPATSKGEPSTKKAKREAAPIVNGNGEAKNIKKQTKKMSRKHLEQYFSQRIVQLMLDHKSEVGALKRAVDSFKEDRDFWKTRADCQSKQLKDLSTVMTKYIIDSKTKPQINGPMRITRSVGLQVGSATASERRGQPNRVGVQRPARPNQVRPSSLNARPVAATPPLQRPNATTSPRQSLPPIPVTNMARQQMANLNRQSQQKPANKPAPEIVEVDLSDDDTPAPAPKARPVQPFRTGPQPKPRVYPLQVQRVTVRHPAPLPNAPVQQYNPALKNVPPKPSLTINKGKEGVVLSWNMTLNLLDHATIASYQLYAYQEISGSVPDKSLWKKVGDVKALPLPMACTLKQFSNGNRYHFAVRACDTSKRQGEFSAPASISI